jgi:hypothetical protein
MFLRRELPGCPVSLRDRVWIEQRIGWLMERLGRGRMAARPKAFPVARDFPGIYDRSPAWAKDVFERVSAVMGVDSSLIDLETFQRKHAPFAAGLYHERSEESPRPRIGFEESNLDDPAELVAIFAHELAHEVLLGGQLLAGEERDEEELTDLTAIYLGMGVFTANSALDQRRIQWNWASTSYLSSGGYLKANQCGYALAVLSWLGRSTDMEWHRWLRPDQADAVRSGLAYLDRCEEPILDRDHPTRPLEPMNSYAELAARLVRPRAAGLMQALLALVDLEHEIPRAAPLLQPLLESPIASLRIAALSLLSQIDEPWPADCLPILSRVATASELDEARAVLTALARRPLATDLCLANRLTWGEHLENQLREPQRKLAVEAAEALAATTETLPDYLMTLLQDVFVEAVMRCHLPADRLWHAYDKCDPSARVNVLARLRRRSPALVESVEEFWLHIDAADNPPDLDEEVDDGDEDWEQFY